MPVTEQTYGSYWVNVLNAKEVFLGDALPGYKDYFFWDISGPDNNRGVMINGSRWASTLA
jgi:hypothetical protein